MFWVEGEVETSPVLLCDLVSDNHKHQEAKKKFKLLSDTGNHWYAHAKIYAAVFRRDCSTPTNLKKELMYIKKKKTLNKEKLGELSELIKKQRPYVSQLYGKPKVFKEIQKIESEFMIKVGKELLKRKIPYLHHCDAMYVRISDREETIRVFEDISEQEFGRKIYLGWSDYQEEGTN